MSSYELGCQKLEHRVIDNELRQADIILLLVSSDFIASDYCMGI